MPALADSTPVEAPSGRVKLYKSRFVMLRANGAVRAVVDTDITTCVASEPSTHYCVLNDRTDRQCVRGGPISAPTSHRH